MSDIALKISNLSFAYDAREPVICDLSLEVPQGQLVAIIGVSGIGKTSLLHNICRLETPSQGEITVLGRELSSINRKELAELRREIGFLFQSGGLFTDLSVYDNIAFPLRENWRLSPATVRDIVMLKLESVGLRGIADMFPGELSGGMQRRVGLARSLVMDPRLVLYDEPFAGLDPISLEVTSQLIKKYNQASAATSIIVTHDIEKTFEIVDYVYLMWDDKWSGKQGDKWSDKQGDKWSDKQGSKWSDKQGDKWLGQGTPAEMRASDDPRVRQFLDAQTDGLLSFHRPAPPLAEELKLRA